MVVPCPRTEQYVLQLAHCRTRLLMCGGRRSVIYSHGCFESKSALVLHRAPLGKNNGNQIPSPFLDLIALQWHRENLKWFGGSLWTAEGSTAIPSLLFFQAACTWFLNHHLYWDWRCQVWAYVFFHPQSLLPNAFIFAAFPLLLRVREGIFLPGSVCWALNWYQKTTTTKTKQNELCPGLFSLCFRCLSGSDPQ